MTALEAENADNSRLRKSGEFVEYCRNAEAEAIRELARTREQLKRAREKHAALFEECEARAVARRKSGQIVNSSQYGD